ncbi:alanyl-tRNA editing protein AlaX [Candidatus Woesearchaeota archaeon]|nr:MAG: alanyl-tRNA editing protein AlaX [Candidatus Woesearchaeota archaeon]
MTELLYMDDSYLKEFNARVARVTDDGIVLDKTVFYLQGGGQPSDTGKIIKYNKEFEVEKVKKVDGNVIHFLKGEWKDSIKEGDEVKGVINWERRYKLMRMHTAAHVLSSVFNKKAGALITGNQLDFEKSRFDFNLEDFDREKILSFVDEVNRLLAEGHEVSISYLPRDDALKDPELVKLASVLPPAVKELRIVTIGSIDRQCDGGTHVKNTKEVGRVVVLKMENKGKNNRRLYFGLEPPAEQAVEKPTL